MKALIAWFAVDRVAANVLMALLVIGGLLTLPKLDRQFYPPVSAEKIKIEATWPSASPADAESGLCIVIEDAIDLERGIKSMMSRATEGQCVVEVDVAPGFDAFRLKDRLQQRIDAITIFPDTLEQVWLEKLTLQDDMIDVAVYGDLDPESLRRLADQVLIELSALPSVSRVEMYGVPDHELAIQVARLALDRYQLSFDDIVTNIRAALTNVPGGPLNTGSGNMLLRTHHSIEQTIDFKKIVLRSAKNGDSLLLRDVATVTKGFSEAPIVARFDGSPAVFFSVFAHGQVETTSKAVKRYVDDRKTELPQNVKMATWLDDTVAFSERVTMLANNAFGALALVFVVLFLFLRLDLAFWVCIGLVTAFIGTFASMWLLDLPLSMMTLFAFIVVLGIVVDDAIVVGENIHQYQKSGASGTLGVIAGTQQIAWPVIVAVSTTVVAFLPGLFLPGEIGEISKPLPLTVMVILVLSLIECLLILPAHLRNFSVELPPSRGHYLDVISTRCSAGLDRLIHRVYVPLLLRVLNRRFLTFSVFFAGLLVVFALLAGGWMRLTVMPEVDDDRIDAYVRLPHDTPFDRVKTAALKVETALEAIKPLDVDNQDHTASIFTHVQSIIREGEAKLTVELNPLRADRIPIRSVVKAWRESIGDLPADVSLEFNYTQWEASNQLKLQVTAPKLEMIRSGSQALKEVLTSYPGIYDISDSYAHGKTELQLRLKPEAVYLGVTLDDLAKQVRQGFQGTVVHRTQFGQKQMNVVVRFQPEDRHSIQSLKSIPLTLPSGETVPLSAIAMLDYRPGFVRIERIDRQRSILVQANVDPLVSDPRQILNALKSGPFQDLQRTYPGLKAGLDKQPREQEVWLSSLAFNGMLAVFGIYILLALFFQSYLQPLLVMLAIPFSIVGAVLGHLLLGVDLTMNSLIGMVAAAGVVVNDSLVLMDRINSTDNPKLNLSERINNACVTRFRPIFLTSLTTFAGLTPIMMEVSTQAQFVIPMAVSLAFGVLFSTVVTLILIPVCYSAISEKFGPQRSDIG